MIDFWNGIHTPDGAVWFNRFTNEYEFEKRPDGFDAYLLGKRAYNMMSKFDINDIVTVPYDHDKKYWTVTAVRTSQIEMRAIYDLVSAKTGIALYDVPEVDMTLVKRPTQKKVYGSTGTVKQIIKASNYEDSQALPFQGESVKDIATRAMAMLLTDVMKGD